jgi:hypothetical protein
MVWSLRETCRSQKIEKEGKQWENRNNKNILDLELGDHGDELQEGDYKSSEFHHHLNSRQHKKQCRLRQVQRNCAEQEIQNFHHRGTKPCLPQQKNCCCSSTPTTPTSISSNDTLKLKMLLECQV